jgi:hypothetical protein
VRFLDSEIVLALAMLLALGVGVLAITAPEPRNCKPTGETRPVTSFIFAGEVTIPYTFQQPVLKCSEKKNIND